MSRRVALEKRLIFGEDGGSLVFIPRALAEELAKLHWAIATSSTWGELSRYVSPTHWAEIVDRLGGEPDAAEPIADDDIPGYGDDWPPWPAQQMLDWVPQSVQGRFGRVAESFASGPMLDLAIAEKEEILTQLRSEGYTCAPDQRLYDRACGYGRPENRRRPDEEAWLRSIELRLTSGSRDEQKSAALELSERPNWRLELRHNAIFSELVRELQAAGDVEGLALFARLSYWGIRAQVIEALGSIGSVQTVRLLIEAGSGRWPTALGAHFDAGQAVREALALNTDPAVVREVLAIATDDATDWSVRETAKRVLGSWPRPGVRMLAELALKGDGPEASAAAAVLEQLQLRSPGMVVQPFELNKLQEGSLREVARLAARATPSTEIAKLLNLPWPVVCALRWQAYDQLGRL